MYENIKYKSKYVGVGFEKQQTAQTLRIWKDIYGYKFLVGVASFHYEQM